MTLPLAPPYPAMEARSVDAIPVGAAWQYEPKWDGFRCLAFRDGDRVALQSKRGEPLERYFPEMVEALRALDARRFVLDGELVIPQGQGLSFDALLMRIHPAASRVHKLAAETPSLYVVFDLLVDERGAAWTARTLAERRPALETFAKRFFAGHPRVRLSPATRDLDAAKRWFESKGAVVDGVIAKRLDCGYRSGDREGMQKIKRKRTADCVVGGFRYASGGRGIGSLLLGLYDDDGLLHHVGFTSGIAAPERRALVAKLEPLVRKPGFTGNAPGGPSRWSTERSTEWQPLAPKLVVEVEYDHVSGGRFRHGTRFLRWRPDKAPRQCTFEQIERRPGRWAALLEPVPAAPARGAGRARPTPGAGTARGSATRRRTAVRLPAPEPAAARGSSKRRGTRSRSAAPSGR